MPDTRTNDEVLDALGKAWSEMLIAYQGHDNAEIRRTQEAAKQARGAVLERMVDPASEDAKAQAESDRIGQEIEATRARIRRGARSVEPSKRFTLDRPRPRLNMDVTDDLVGLIQESAETQAAIDALKRELGLTRSVDVFRRVLELAKASKETAPTSS